MFAGAGRATPPGTRVPGGAGGRGELGRDGRYGGTRAGVAERTVVPYTTVRRPGRCGGCAAGLSVGMSGFWDPQARVMCCLGCRPRHAGGGGGGLSVRRAADAAAAAHRGRLRSRWGPLAPLVGLVGGPDPEVARYAKGAAGEEKVAGLLGRAGTRHGWAVLNDRSIPGRRENIDHLVVTTGGVWVVDAKSYTGRIRPGAALMIGHRSGDKLLEQSRRLVGFVTEALARSGVGGVAVHGALCFVDGDLGWWAQGRTVAGVRVFTQRPLVRALAADIGTLDVAAGQDLLGRWFPPAP